ncbi:D-3-phosphoglycerate dehydrogenase [Colletotrichum spaethianum]|uniref:D-3-phosphoglycerate dehydrogenase n=1 Tax=Colletotrichum spaethianum TaxID=700344 RepID=A0AA37LGZ4_9PEZI|nr:D-3-phosphoglycerate dehydrogenase [Colletotrichum spaethianum]GKT47304.1 D-3-phosphoglycerate dehydrogenase [Colletotrichum spaethianum]
MAPSAVSDLPVQSSPNAKPTVYVLDSFQPEVIAFCQENFNAILPGEPKHARWKEAQYLMIRSSKLSAEDIVECPNLLAIGKQGVGIDKIDADACSARGIKIFNTPGVNARAVAELVLTLTTAVARQVGTITRKQNSGIVVPKEKCSGFILHRKTIGILGMGNIGKCVAQIFRGAFEAHVIAYDPYLPAEAWGDIPHHRAQSAEEVLSASDVVTVHMPLTPTTRDLIGYAQMKNMKKTAIVINTARGGIINEADLERALSEGLIWGAGLDCHEQEPPSQEKYGALWESGALSTPHIGAATRETQVQTGMAAAVRLLEYITSREN